MEKWFSSNINDPYPSIEVKNDLAKQTGLTLKQITIFLENARKRQKNVRKHIKIENKLILLKHFDSCQNPGIEEVEKLSVITGITEKKIKAWFRMQKFDKNKKIV